MNVPFLLFVIAILLFAIFWELCKINSRLKKTFPIPHGGGNGQVQIKS
jgi:hypothetical protein